MNARIPLLLAFVVATGAAYYFGRQAAPPAPPAAGEPAGLHQPTRQPDRLVLTWNGDPARSQAVTWRTSTDVASAVAEIALAEDGPLFVEKAQQVPATTETLESDRSVAHYHSAVFADLEPETLYVYRVGDGAEDWSEWQQFRTMAAETKPLTFLYVGDAQNDVFSLWSRLIREGYSVAPDAHFIIHAGDLINRANRDIEWGGWFAAAGWINGKLASIPTPGNHEYEKSEDASTLSRHWRPTFTLPENGPAGPPLETAYYLDIQGVRVIALNSNEAIKEQAAWLEGVLADNPNRWTVVTHHHPVHSVSRGRDNPELRALWQPIYDKHRVDLVLQGHDHTYGRGSLQTGESVQAGAGGTVYAVSVSGPKMYEVTDQPWMVRSAEDTQLFQRIRIDGDLLTYEAFTARGLLYDAFELRKRDREPNQIKELPVELPQRRRTAP